METRNTVIFHSKIPVYIVTTQALNTNTILGNLFAIFHNTNTQRIAAHILITKKLLSATKVRKKGFPSCPNSFMMRNWLISPSAITSDNNVPKRYSILRRLIKWSMIDNILSIVFRMVKEYTNASRISLDKFWTSLSTIHNEGMQNHSNHFGSHWESTIVSN